MRAKTESLPGMFLRVATRRTYRKAQSTDAIFAAFVGKTELDVLEKVRGSQVVVVIPYSFEAGRYWDSKGGVMIVSLTESARSAAPN
jgi:hypothetical protein